MLDTTKCYLAKIATIEGKKYVSVLNLLKKTNLLCVSELTWWLPILVFPILPVQSQQTDNNVIYHIINK